jgi:transposase-like protein
MSMAAVAMANGVNANLLRRWVREAEMRPGAELSQPLVAPTSPVKASPAAFVAVGLPAKGAAPDIRIELRRGSTSIAVTWPTEAAAECAAWMRELLR